MPWVSLAPHVLGDEILRTVYIKTGSHETPRGLEFRKLAAEQEYVESPKSRRSPKFVFFFFFATNAVRSK